MEILENISLKPYNTFGIDAVSSYFTSIHALEELINALHWAHQAEKEVLVLGGGSNILFTKDFDGIVIINQLLGIEKIKEDDDYVYVKAGAGVVWHEFVQFCLENDYAGAENLALIPGSVGASPMQNIGAYGVEIKDIFYELTALHKFDLTLHTFTNEACKFGYRESVFKNIYKDEYIILDVTYQLRKQPIFRTEYGAIKEELERMNVTQLTIQDVAQAVIHIRTSKLPDPKDIGNSGSFFKNPSVPKSEFEALKIEYPSMIGYENKEGTVKLAAGWMIEQCGFKGYKKGDAGVHIKQALVLVNYGLATGKEILHLSKEIIDAVHLKFGVFLEPEVNIV